MLFRSGTWFTSDDAAALVIYSLLVLQVATSNNWSVRALGRSWRMLHWVASYAIFAGFFVTYLGRLQENGGIILVAYLPSLSALGYCELRPFSVEVEQSWLQHRSSPGLIKMTLPRSRLPVPLWFEKVQWQRGNLEPSCARLGQGAQSARAS